jgi:hypothetical protein
LLNIFPILPGLLNLAQSVLPLPDGTPKRGAVEPPAPPTDALVRVDLPPYRYIPISAISGGTGGSPDGQQVPPFGPPPIYVMPPVWTGTPYRPWPPYVGMPLPPIPPYLWVREPWWPRGPVLRTDPPRYKGIEPPTPPKKPWYEVIPFRPGDPIPEQVAHIDPIELQPRPGQPILPPEPNISVPPSQTTPPAPPKQEPPPPPPQPEPVKTTPPKQPTTWFWDYWREGRQD